LEIQTQQASLNPQQLPWDKSALLCWTDAGDSRNPEALHLASCMISSD
jgi:hypothetical protein